MKYMQQLKISVVIPTLNAGKQIVPLLDALDAQSVKPDEIIIADSESSDQTRELINNRPGLRMIPILRKEFDHGGTRDMALRQSTGDIVLFLTQDALPVSNTYIEQLIKPFADEKVAAAGGRQIAYPDARPFEKAVRKRNYPDEERIWSAEDIGQLGIRAFLISDVCAAYRRTAYLAVGGFDHPILTNEDMLMAERLLHAGYKLVYCGSAAVYHSHRFTLKQEYMRNYIIGQTMKRYEVRFEHVQEMGTGMKLAWDVLTDLIKGGHFVECICFTANCAARLLGNRMGRTMETRRSP